MKAPRFKAQRAQAQRLLKQDAAPAPRVRAQLALVDLVPPKPPEGAPIVECVFSGNRVRVRAVSGQDTTGSPVVPGTWCRFPPKKRHAGAQFAVGHLTRILREHTSRFYYATSGPFWLLVPGGSP